MLGMALSQRHDVQAVGFTYGSKHNSYENTAALKLCKYYGVPLFFVDLTDVMGHFRSDLLKTGGNIPEGHYEDSTMSRTVVPGRNIIFTSILSGMAWSNNCDQIWIGAHSGDHAIYPDCRPEFIRSMASAIAYGTDYKVSLKTPLLELNKTGILVEGQKLGVPYNLTRTCYKDQQVACGRCGSCQERLEAFANCGIEDPLEYESREILPKASV